MSTSDEHFAKRLAKLERDNRWLKLACLGGVLLCAAAAAPPQTDSADDPLDQAAPDLPILQVPDLSDDPELPTQRARAIVLEPQIPLPPPTPLPILEPAKLARVQTLVEPSEVSQVFIGLPKDSRQIELEVKRLFIVDDEGRRCGVLSAEGLEFTTPDGKQLVSLDTKKSAGRLTLTNQRGDRARIGGEPNYHLQFVSGYETPVFLSYGLSGGYLLMGGSSANRLPDTKSATPEPAETSKSGMNDFEVRL